MIQAWRFELYPLTWPEVPDFDLLRAGSGYCPGSGSPSGSGPMRLFTGLLGPVAILAYALVLSAPAWLLYAFLRRGQRRRRL